MITNFDQNLQSMQSLSFIPDRMEQARKPSHAAVPVKDNFFF
jgi:hypothetical protein